MSAAILEPAGCDDPASMTPAIALQVYSASDMDHWHTQPSCRCGDYLSYHLPVPPFRCRVCSGREGDRCSGYRNSGAWFG